MEAKVECPPVQTLPGDKKALWGMRELMSFLRFDYTTTWRLIHKYGLTCYQFGEETSPLRFNPDEVVAWAEKFKMELKQRSASSSKKNGGQSGED